MRTRSPRRLTPRQYTYACELGKHPHIYSGSMPARSVRVGSVIFTGCPRCTRAVEADFELDRGRRHTFQACLPGLMPAPRFAAPELGAAESES